MKLRDIISEETVKDYTERLVKTLGIKELGSGFYSSVFQHPIYRNVAVKLCRRRDPASISYLRKAAENPDNPWFPKVISIHKVTFHPEGTSKRKAERDLYGDLQNYLTHIVFMQKLKPVTRKQYSDAVRLMFSTLPSEVFQYPEEAYNYSKHEHGGFRAQQERIAANRRAYAAGRIFPPLDQLDSFANITKTEWKVIAKKSTDAHVRQLAQTMFDIGAQDIHQGNVMLNPDGHPVITDPVAS